MTAIEIKDVFHSLLHRLAIDVIAIDTEGHIVYWERGFGAAPKVPEELMGKHLLEVFPQMRTREGPIDWNLEIFTHVLDEGRHIEVRRQSRKVGDVILWFDVLAWPLKKEGKIIGAILASIDVSDRQRLEQELIRQAKTQSLANLGASIAHEIRNPLNAMALNLQLVREGIENKENITQEEQVADLNLALDEIKRLDSIVRNFLQFARPPKTSMTLDSPNRAVETVISMLKESARKQGVELTNACTAVPNVLMDHNRIVEAVFNLAQNALQAITTSNGQVTLGTTLGSDGVAIYVEDNGPGIPDEMKDQIFELYFSTKDEDGTGLGLPYADSIAKEHNGQLTLKSEIGKGSTFTMLLPLSIQSGTSS